MPRLYKYTSLPGDSDSQPILSVNFIKFACTTVSLPLFAFIFCVIWSIIFNFEEANNTHCKVYNFLPSISAAIGSFSPQKHVWRIAIFLHVLPRFIIPILYKKHFQEVIYPQAHFLGNVACILNSIELLALTGLTNWSSNENYPLHKFSFLLFIITSESYMLTICTLLQRWRRIPANHVESQSLKLKWKLFLLNISCFCFAGYFFMRHDWYCEAGVYSMFALAEYMVVFSNIAFHMTVCWDFHGSLLIWDNFGFYLI